MTLTSHFYLVLSLTFGFSPLYASMVWCLDKWKFYLLLIYLMMLTQLHGIKWEDSYE